MDCWIIHYINRLNLSVDNPPVMQSGANEMLRSALHDHLF
ncbi:hypothetical protein SAMN00120144_1292 [Hymenobacter roseosalivarius DSM 11622]|uniref:Uncharacterized protein n=1 Tax=Hymenobacter roseosalivarius DSM 11622 TaxID=645990 RepID=A0A1W1W4I3_9BACT|nr:hypothetical protein SAMN00120144_1292 [Hymenobacter roseosalivarius DSM 11622]